MQFVQIIWDEPKRFSNFAKHGIDFAHVAAEFDFRAAVTAPAREGRYKAIGSFGEAGVIVVIFKSLGVEALSLVSVRAASWRERTLYEDAKKNEKI
jgi:hypothetical protein